VRLDFERSREGRKKSMYDSKKEKNSYQANDQRMVKKIKIKSKHQKINNLVTIHPVLRIKKLANKATISGTKPPSLTKRQKETKMYASSPSRPKEF
jgi:hypothetical protein